MPAAKTEAPARVLVPTAAETGTTAVRRVRLAKALAATSAAKKSGMTRAPDQSGISGAKAKKFKPGSHRYKLPDDEYAQLTALKQRLETLGSQVKRSELLRAGLLLLVAMNDEQLRKAVARVAVIEFASHSQQAA
ncbi:MAG: hypothetical protein Q8J99_19840 [Sulfuritalea sp.]|nr:hypothetical protein [Sulfuritalea sp.]